MLNYSDAIQLDSSLHRMAFQHIILDIKTNVQTFALICVYSIEKSASTRTYTGNYDAINPHFDRHQRHPATSSPNNRTK